MRSFYKRKMRKPIYIMGITIIFEVVVRHIIDISLILSIWNGLGSICFGFVRMPIVLVMILLILSILYMFVIWRINRPHKKLGYSQNTFLGVDWKWKVVGKLAQGIFCLFPVCPECGLRLVYKHRSNEHHRGGRCTYTRSAWVECDDCNFSSDILGCSKREIEDKISRRLTRLEP